ncbi:MAG: guanylate kinase [Woeseiaceae bacterium]|nr:guanylate kinase [Woeseiaceae bacterium]
MGDDSNLYVLAAPSGAGKTTLVKKLVERNPDLKFSISYTTRRKRRTERDGVDYLFVDKARFDELKSAGELLESAEVFDNFYGTSRTQVSELLAAGHDVMLEIDWQGARQVRESMPDSVSIFILPPSLAELERRLRDRRTDDEAVIERRLRDAVSDMSHWDEFDHVIINDDLEQAVRDLEAVIRGNGGGSSTRNVALRRAVSRIVG